MRMAVVGIIPAGGSGERLGADRPKAFVVCAGRPLIEWSLEVLGAVGDRVVVAAPEGYADGPDRVRGGDSRSASVRNALAAAPEATVAVVHDAARPLVTRDLVERCLAALEPGVDGAIAAVPMTDTVKEAASDGRVVRTLKLCAGVVESVTSVALMTTRASRPTGPARPVSQMVPAGCSISVRPYAASTAASLPVTTEDRAKRLTPVPRNPGPNTSSTLPAATTCPFSSTTTREASRATSSTACDT